MAPDRLSERMAALARELRTESEPGEALQRVVESAVELIENCETAGITLAERDGKVSTSAFTGDVHRRLDELQQELGEGPCLDAVWREPVVHVRDLAEEQRWPTWSARAVDEVGTRSMLCVQLFTNEDRVGAMNLFSSHPDAFDEAAIEAAVGIAAHASVAVGAAEHIGHLHTAIHNRTVIGQATGLVMVKYELGSVAAFALLRRLSSEQNRKISAIATDIVDTWDKDKFD
jgi:GAF domain-containing protein